MPHWCPSHRRKKCERCCIAALRRCSKLKNYRGRHREVKSFESPMTCSIALIWMAMVGIHPLMMPRGTRLTCWRIPCFTASAGTVELTEFYVWAESSMYTKDLIQRLDKAAEEEKVRNATTAIHFRQDMALYLRCCGFDGCGRRKSGESGWRKTQRRRCGSRQSL